VGLIEVFPHPSDLGPVHQLLPLDPGPLRVALTWNLKFDKEMIIGDI